MSRNRTKPVTVLLVEDCRSDIELISEVFNCASVSHQLQVVRDGLTATAYLNQENGYIDAPRPNLILLDLHLPKKNGLQILAEIKSDFYLCAIPVIVLTSSSNPEDMINCYQMDANCYITKPSNLKEFRHIVTIIEDFWLKYVILPTK